LKTEKNLQISRRNVSTSKQCRIGGRGGRNYLFGKIYKFMELQYKEKGIRIDHKFDQVLLIL